MKKSKILTLSIICCVVFLFVLLFFYNFGYLFFEKEENGHLASFLFDMNKYVIEIPEDKKESLKISWNGKTIYENKTFNKKNINYSRYIYGDNYFLITLDNVSKEYYFFKPNNWEFHEFKITINSNEEIQFWIDNTLQSESSSIMSKKNEMITVEEINERLNFNNPEVKEYFKPFYDKLKKMDLEKPTPEDQIKLFYETIKVLDEEYNFNIFDFDYTPSDELTGIFHKIFSEDEIWQNIISNLHTKASQQPDRFLDTIKTIKIKDISVTSIDDKECTCLVRAEASHWFYAIRSLDFTKKMYFKYYDDICINEEDLERYEQKALEEYEEIGEGKPWGTTINLEENHVFHLVKKDGIFKIKDFVFNITSISDY